jgi:hypothetical protein
MTGLYAGLAGLAAILLLALLYGRRSRRLGRLEGGNAEREATLDLIRKSEEIDEDISRMRDADLYAELHDTTRGRVRLGQADHRK